MIFNKKRLEEQYQNITAYLSVHQDIVNEIEGLKKYHENALLDEKIVKTNGVLMAIYYYYLEDIKEEALKMKTATEEEKKEIQIRIESDKFFIDSLEKSALINEVKERLKDNALALSGGQQQRLCIARCIALSPEVILMDEPTSALDPIATSKIEELIRELKKDYTIIIVTHNMQQATRISDYTAFFMLGDLVEYNKTEEFFAHPQDKRSDDYISGKFS